MKELWNSKLPITINKERSFMKATKILLAMCFVAALCTGVAAHEPPGVTYFAFGFPAHALPSVDGDGKDWDMVPELYHIDLGEDFEETVRGIGSDLDLEDINIKNIIGWNEETNRIYSWSIVVDDFLHNKRENPAGHNWDDDINLIIDADHSGGDLYESSMHDLEDSDRLQVEYTTGQLYTALVPPIDGWWLFMYHHDTEFAWLTDGKTTPSPDYLEVGWSVTGQSEGPGAYTYELKVTPWIFLDYQGVDGSTELDMNEGMVIHVGYVFKDYDTDESYEGSYDFPPIHNVWRNANLCGDFELLPVDLDLFPGATSVETDTWGRIKASMLTE